MCRGTVRGGGVRVGSGWWRARGVRVASGSAPRPDFLSCPQCELSALEGMKACMTYFPRACGSLKVSIHRKSSAIRATLARRLSSGPIAEVSEPVC